METKSFCRVELSDQRVPPLNTPQCRKGPQQSGEASASPHRCANTRCAAAAGDSERQWATVCVERGGRGHTDAAGSCSGSANMQPPAPSSSNSSVGRLLLMALSMTVALTILVVGCAVDDSWWSLLTALCYFLALGCWALFQPGCLPCMATPLPGAAPADGAGLCGGKLCKTWGEPPTVPATSRGRYCQALPPPLTCCAGSFLVAFFGSSTFGAAATMYHADKTDTLSFVTSMVSGALVMGLVIVEVPPVSA
jgi:hypothetical protein